MMLDPLSQHLFIVPPLDGPPTGGTVFNRLLIEALVAARQAVSWRAWPSTCSLGPADALWVDSLYLREFPGIKAQFSCADVVALIVHYLPSWLHQGAQVTWGQLSDIERRALEAAQAFLVTSTFTRNKLREFPLHNRPVLVVEPGRLAHAARADRRTLECVEAVMVAHLLPNKGVLEFLRELDPISTPDDVFALHLIGSDLLDADYAARCQQWLTAQRYMSGRVRWHGALSPPEVIRRMADCNLVVSASRMETYGIALAEARTLGLPIVAHAGGNVASIVDPSTGGELVASARELAASFLRLCRSRELFRARSKAAMVNAWPARPWLQAAGDFLEQCQVHQNDRANEVNTSIAPTQSTVRLA